MEKTRTCEIFVDELGILHVKMLGGVIIDLEDAVDNFLVAKHLTKGKPFLKLIDARKIFIIKKEAHSLVKNENNSDKHIAKAILIGSFISRYMNHFFLSLENSKFPVKVFTSEKEALKWLKSFI